MSKFSRIKQKALVCAGAVSAVALTAGTSMAAITVDYAGLGTAVEAEITTGLGVFLPLGGVVLAIGLAWKIGKRFLKG